MKTLLLILPCLLLSSCEAFNKLTPEQQAKIFDRGLSIVDAATGRIVGKINPASGQMPVRASIQK